MKVNVIKDLINQQLKVWSLIYAVPQELEVGANPVQVEVGEFDEAIEVDDVAAESK